MRAMADPIPFATPADWNAWLAANHATETEVWVLYWKKSSGVASIDWQQGVIEALCWGWIDGIRKSYDDQRFIQRFSPRRPGSVWSKINCDHVERLTTEGRMRSPGLAAVAIAKSNGRWDTAYSGGMANTVVPPDFLAALTMAGVTAQANWDGLDTRNRYAICYRIGAVKKAETRARKIAEFVALLLRGEKLI